MELQYEKDNKERIPFEHYMEAFQNADPLEISQRTGLPYDEEKQIFTVNLMGVTYKVKFPEYEVTHVEEDVIQYYPLEEAVNARILVLRFMIEGCKAVPSEKFITYREAPWGSVYMQQFNGRCILRFAYGYGNKQDRFENAMKKIQAKKIAHGDVGYELEFMDGYRLQMMLWAGDDEFPPSSQILFSDNFPAAFHTEDMAVVGDIVISMIKALA